MGAGPAGLACAMTMRAAGLDVTVLEKADSVGSAWRRHYDRLHLHTDRKHSGLPGMAMPRTYPTYPSRAAGGRRISKATPRVSIFGLFSIRRSRRSGAMARNGARDTRGGSISAPVVVVATGLADAPVSPCMARFGSLSRPGHPQQRISQSGSLCRQSACWWSDLAIPAARSRSISPRPASTSLLRFAARFRSCRAICSAFRL